MGFFDLFTSRNPDVLNNDEKEAAEILKNILQSHQNGDNNFGSDEVTQLAVGLYYLSFRRTGKKIVRVEEFVNIDAIFSGNTKGLQYASVFEAIKQTIENGCHNTSRLNSVVTLQDCEKAILVTLKTAAKKFQRYNMAAALLILASLLFIVTFGIHATIMAGDPMERPAYTTHPIFGKIPAISAFILPVIAWSMILDLHWIWIFILNFLFGFFFSRWLTKGFIVRFASGKGLGKDMLVAFIAGLIAFIIGTAIYVSRDKSEDSTYHQNSKYKYEHRTGTTDNYTYNYDVSGTDENGNSVSGNIDMQGKYGNGTLTGDDGNETEVEVEWVGSGQLTATDDEGNTYDLEVD